jgi:hypothetical protein
VPRARLNTPEGRTTEWKSQALRASALDADALIASCYLAPAPIRVVCAVRLPPCSRRLVGSGFGGCSEIRRIKVVHPGDPHRIGHSA